MPHGVVNQRSAVGPFELSVEQTSSIGIMNHIRQGQNNNNNNSKRSRGRGRKPQGNNGNRAYDSNGPDVKIRGTATHVCEKYQQLARDAITSGDRVMAENYYQHAEHYYRLIMAAQAPSDGQPRPQNALGYRPDEDQEYDEDDNEMDQAQPQSAGQPYHQQNNNNNGNGGNNGHQQNGGERRGNEDGNNRNDRNNRNNIAHRNNNRNERNDRDGNSTERTQQAGGSDEAPRVHDQVAPEEAEQPSIMPVAAEAAPEVAVAETPVVAEAGAEGDAAEAPRRRAPRRRRPRAEGAADAEAGGTGSDEVPV
tara:strand:- start:3 stop:926 length:924 start_codon:yes stop_codon:yes gene_type:complete